MRHASRVDRLAFTHAITITEGPPPWRGSIAWATEPLRPTGVRAFVRLESAGLSTYGYVIDQGAATRLGRVWATGLLFEIHGARSSDIPDRLAFRHGAFGDAHPIEMEASARIHPASRAE